MLCLVLPPAAWPPSAQLVLLVAEPLRLLVGEINLSMDLLAGEQKSLQKRCSKHLNLAPWTRNSTKFPWSSHICAFSLEEVEFDQRK